MKDRIAGTRFRAPPLWIPLGILGALLLAIASLSLIQVVATSIEKKANPAPGALVRVGGKSIHVLAAGSGATTFVLLGGGGVGAPALEYRPLWSRLAERGRVAVVEYPGYGWSEDTRAPRNADAIVEEIRAALLGAGFKPPYVLVAHSLGGIYAMAYARSHADELEAVIALDTTLPRALIQERERSGTEAGSRIKGLPRFDLIALARETGILRALLRLKPLLVSGAPEGVYSPEEARRIAMVSSWGYAGKALVNEFESLEGNMAGLFDFAFPRSLPVLMIQANPPGGRSEAALWSLKERTRLTAGLDRGEVIELPAGHSGIYWLLSDEIVREICRFLI